MLRQRRDGIAERNHKDGMPLLQVRQEQHQEPEDPEEGCDRGCHRIHRVLQHEAAEGTARIPVTCRIQAAESKRNLSGHNPRLKKRTHCGKQLTAKGSGWNIVIGRSVNHLGGNLLKSVSIRRLGCTEKCLLNGYQFFKKCKAKGNHIILTLYFNNAICLHKLLSTSKYS